MAEREWEHEKERVDSTVKEGRFQGGKGGQAKRASLGVCANALQDDPQSLGFTVSLTKPEIGNTIGRQRACS